MFDTILNVLDKIFTIISICISIFLIISIFYLFYSLTNFGRKVDNSLSDFLIENKDLNEDFKDTLTNFYEYTNSVIDIVLPNLPQINSNLNISNNMRSIIPKIPKPNINKDNIPCPLDGFQIFIPDPEKIAQCAGEQALAVAKKVLEGLQEAVVVAEQGYRVASQGYEHASAAAQQANRAVNAAAQETARAAQAAAQATTQAAQVALQGASVAVNASINAVGSVLGNMGNLASAAANTLGNILGCISINQKCLIFKHNKQIIINMKDINIGDDIITDKGLSKVIHIDNNRNSLNMIKIYYEEDKYVIMTLHHLIYKMLNNKMILIPASKLQIGDYLYDINNKKKKIIKMEMTEEIPINILTINGNINIDGIICSSYTTTTINLSKYTLLLAPIATKLLPIEYIPKIVNMFINLNKITDNNI